MANGLTGGRTRERVGVMVALAALAALSWFYLAHIADLMPSSMVAGGGAMTGHAGMEHMSSQNALVSQFSVAVTMWSIMMVAMMLPTAMPAANLYGILAQRRAAGAAAPVGLFTAGYLANWIGYAVVAAAAQLALSQASLLSPMVRSTSIALSVSILLAAGVFQFTPLKDQCLTKCRSPLAFFLAEWRDGRSGALLLGLRHGGYCVACCWALMAVMFVVGAMNLTWMAALALLVLGEKFSPARWKLSHLAGAVLIVWAVLVAADLFH